MSDRPVDPLQLSAVDLASLLVGIVGGGTAAALVTSRHAAAERTRERLLTTAEAFLTASDRARVAVRATAAWWNELGDASAALDGHLGKLGQGEGSTEEKEQFVANEQLQPLLRRAFRACEEAVSEMVAGMAVPSRWQTELDEIFAAADAIGAEVELTDSQSDFALLIHSLITRMHRATASLRECYASLDVLTDALPRVRLTFMIGATDDPVTFAAFRIAEYAVSGARLMTSRNENFTPTSELGEMKFWQGEFARRVAARLHPWRTALLARIRFAQSENAEPTGAERLDAIRASEQHLEAADQASSSADS